MTRWRWGTVKEYVWVYNDSAKSPAYQRKLLSWLEKENPRIHALVLKELKIDRARSSSTPEEGPVIPLRADGGRDE